jgi:proteasome assembly chaperone (PAC2) family protein
MDQVEWIERPYLRDPIALVAFEGWNDAADAASGAVGYLLEQHRVEPFAKVDGEEFMNFQETRPIVETSDTGERVIHWPATGLFAVTLTGNDRDLVIVLGEEPHHRWRTFCTTLLSVMREVGVRHVTTLGAFIGQVPHTLPVPVFGSASDEEVMVRHDLFGSGYEGPTGIIGVLNNAAAKAGFETLSLWAGTPHYLAANPNPKAMLALLEKFSEVTGTDLNLAELHADGREFDVRVEEALDESEDIADYVRQLEEENEDTPIRPVGGDELAAEIERYLRGSD